MSKKKLEKVPGNTRAQQMKYIEKNPKLAQSYHSKKRNSAIIGGIAGLPLAPIGPPVGAAIGYQAGKKSWERKRAVLSKSNTVSAFGVDHDVDISKWGNPMPAIKSGASAIKSAFGLGSKAAATGNKVKPAAGLGLGGKMAVGAGIKTQQAKTIAGGLSGSFKAGAAARKSAVPINTSFANSTGKLPNRIALHAGAHPGGYAAGGAAGAVGTAYGTKKVKNTFGSTSA